MLARALLATLSSLALLWLVLGNALTPDALSG